MKCHEYEGYAHFQTECATYLKWKKKGLTIILSDEDTFLDSECESYGWALISGAVEEISEQNSVDILQDQQYLR